MKKLESTWYVVWGRGRGRGERKRETERDGGVTYIVYMCVLLFFSSFAHQTARESTEIACPLGIQWSIMVITRKYYDPVYKPPSPLLPNASMQRGAGVIADSVHCIYTHVYIVHTYPK